MKDYIEREAACELLAMALDDDWEPEYAADRLNEVPAADVKPVVRGKWETVMLDHEWIGCRPKAHYCSECHQITWFRTFYCPNCGADMRGEN